MVSGSGPLTGSAGRISTTAGAPSVGSDCQHSRMQVVSQAAWTRPSQGSDPSAQEPTSDSPGHTADQPEPRLPATAAGAHGAHTRKFEAGIRQRPTGGLGGENIYHRRRPSVRTNCRHSRMQVDSQAVWTRPSQGSDPSALELTSVSPCHTANQREPTTPRRRQLACMGLTKFADGIRQWPTDGLGGENIYHRRRPLSRFRLSAQQPEDASRLTGRLELALAGV